MDEHERTTDGERLRALVGLAVTVRDACRDLGVEPVVTASLAVWAHTGDAAVVPGDVDLACPAACFPALRRALEARGLRCEETEWHVLQVRDGDLKVDVDAAEVWHVGLPGGEATALLLGETFTVDSRQNLVELYRRGVASTEDDRQRRRYEERLRALDAATPSR